MTATKEAFIPTSEPIGRSGYPLEAPRGIFAAMAQVYNKVGYVTKTPSPELRYTYASESELIAALRPAMVEAGIIMRVANINDVKHETYTTRTGASMNRVTLSGVVEFICVADGSSIFSFALGEGSDAGDKATYKAMTGMFKYALRQTFCIETGDDPDKELSDGMERAAISVDMTTALAAPKRYSPPTTPTAVSAAPATRSKYASGRKIGTVETVDGQLMIECPNHGWTRARQFNASGTRPAVIKCTRNDGTREAPSWCSFGIDVADDGTPVVTPYHWIPAFNELMKVNGDVVTLEDIGLTIGVTPPTFKAIDQWITANPMEDIYSLFSKASVTHEMLADGALVDGTEAADLPFE